MAKKTVVRRACKSIIGTLNDSSLFAQAIREAANTSDAAEVEQEISENANAAGNRVRLYRKFQSTTPRQARYLGRRPVLNIKVIRF